MRKIVLMLLTANLFFGVALIAILPPFEGIDETAHFSRLKSQAFVSQIPAPRPPGSKESASNQRIVKEVFDYYRNGPMPFGWITFDTLHNEDQRRGYTTYTEFFHDMDRNKDYVARYRHSPLSDGYDPGPEVNWQYQHPPLYYMMLAPVMKFAAGKVSLATAILLLRLASYALAFAGLCIGAWGSWKYLASLGMPDAGTIVALGLLYPFLMPEFFWEFARIGNDSLCLFLFGIIWAMLLWHLRAPRSDAWMFLGFFMGISWLTKALMIPVTAGIVALLAVHHIFTVRKQPEHARDWWMAPLKTAGLLMLIGAPVYLISYSHAGGVGSGEINQLAQTGSIGPLLQKTVSWHTLKDGLREIIYTGIWGWGYASWSEMAIDMPDFLYKALYVFVGIVLIAYVAESRYRAGPMLKLSLFTLGPMFAGLVVHVFMMRMLAPDKLYPPATPGYYVHILAPCYVLMFGLGLAWLADRRRLKIAAACCGTAIVLFNFYIAWSFTTAFTGCAATSYKGNIYWIKPADIWTCAGQAGSVFDRLSILAWPGLALVSFGLTFVALLAAALFALSAQHSKPRPLL